MNARPQAWLAQARSDLDLAQLACRNGFLAQACYFASQAAEKALKSALLELGLEPPHTHVLGDLLTRLQSAGLDTAAFETLPLKALSRMGPDLSARERKVVEALSKGIINKILHTPVTNLRAPQPRQQRHIAMKVVEDLFELHDPQG